MDTTPETLRAGTANGFVFEAATVEACTAAVARALDTRRETATWQRVIQRGMRQDFSWRASAREYLRLYEQLRQDVRRRSTAPAVTA